MADQECFNWYPTDNDKRDICILCGESWGYHYRLVCAKHAHKYTDAQQDDVTQIPREERFLTRGIRDRYIQWSAEQKAKKQRKQHASSFVPTSSSDEPDWKKFQHKAAGECPCGTNRDACIYHG